jgi:hypothetical protein
LLLQRSRQLCQVRCPGPHRQRCRRRCPGDPLELTVGSP